MQQAWPTQQYFFHTKIISFEARSEKHLTFDNILSMVKCSSDLASKLYYFVNNINNTLIIVVVKLKQMTVYSELI